MARAAELVDLIARLTGLEHAKVTRYARFAREAGYMSQSGRGLSAAHMTAKDAAYLLVCVLDDGIAQEASTTLKHIGYMEMNSEDVRDQNDDNKWQKGDRERLRTVLPVLFEPEHSFIDFLIALIEQAEQGSTVFEERYRQSTIDYDCGDYCALVHLDIDPDCAPWQTDDHIFISRIYLHPQFGAKSDLFRRSTQLKFEVITRIGELIARK